MDPIDQARSVGIRQARVCDPFLILAKSQRGIARCLGLERRRSLASTCVQDVAPELQGVAELSFSPGWGQKDDR
eukprot:CAMPEP_0203909504 /NCGR_PEP_ID=MMETSP0359-20131031/50809_1 /ASSEMBLY_ACC=CAM_ASM_000338 /TAXON_ID=268821 /ORGANISM="Scrippsiella Hangoei, Strain SHTV-5" /LENGTH=73 /DNA_ID=CAMNT_0050834761 /DNA_START=150 /DNA_END=369 /DNA_ORIENTATION=+